MVAPGVHKVVGWHHNHCTFCVLVNQILYIAFDINGEKDDRFARGAQHGADTALTDTVQHPV